MNKMNKLQDKYLVSEANMSQSKLKKAFKDLPTETRNRLVMAVWGYTNPETIVGSKLFTTGATNFTDELINRLNVDSYNDDSEKIKSAVKGLKLDKEWVFNKKDKVFLHKDKHNGYK